MSGCIQNTKNITCTIKDTAYIIERETGEILYNVQTKTDKRKILSSGNILKALQ